MHLLPLKHCAKYLHLAWYYSRISCTGKSTILSASFCTVPANEVVNVRGALEEDLGEGPYMLLNSGAITSALGQRLSAQIKGKTFQFELTTDSKHPMFDLLEIYTENLPYLIRKR